MEKLSRVDNIIPRNSVSFGEILVSKGLTYADIYYYLNGNGISKFNDVLTKSGTLVQGEGGRYLGRKEFQASDNGQRSPEELRLDCEVGNIQEAIFCLDNPDFKQNPKATNKDIKSDEEITSHCLDLIHIPTGTEVEFKVAYSKMYGKEAYYMHRNGKLKEFLDAGNILIVYFIKLDKVAVICKKNWDGSVRLKETMVKNNKVWDKVTVWNGLMINYEMMRRGNYEISRIVSNIIRYGKNK